MGELEVMEHLYRGLSLIDSRPAEAYGSFTIHGARNMPHDKTAERIGRKWSMVPARGPESDKRTSAS